MGVGGSGGRGCQKGVGGGGVGDRVSVVCGVDAVKCG